MPKLAEWSVVKEAVTLYYNVNDEIIIYKNDYIVIIVNQPVLSL